jgi:hypothetical protein
VWFAPFKEAVLLGADQINADWVGVRFGPVFRSVAIFGGGA